MTVLNRAEDVAAELKARLLTLTIAQGAETDIGRKVFQGRRKVDDSMLPCVSMIEGDDVPARETNTTTYELAQRYVLFAYLPCDADDPNIAAHAALRDLKRAVFTTGGRPSVTWGSKVKSVEYLGRDIGPRADGASFVLASIEIAVTFVEALHNP
ncbi:MAG: hypothetical protein KA224_07955 [Steroidobacteraceae bacterium]|nr:hypothetical protein [Steroidobacteraceae bacterium]